MYKFHLSLSTFKANIEYLDDMPKTKTRTRKNTDLTYIIIY